MTSTDGTGTSPNFGTSPVRLPIIKGDGWFDSEHKQFILCVEYPLSAEEMVAALYGVVDLGDIASDEDLCGSVAVTLSNEGLPALGVRAAKIGRDERDGTVRSVSFLAECRERVTALLQTHG